MMQGEVTTQVLTMSSEAEYRRFYEVWEHSRQPVIISFTFFPANPFQVMSECFVESTATRLPVPREERAS